MKLFTKIFIALALLFPFTTFALTATWQATSTTSGIIFPTAINGVQQVVQASSYFGSSTATSTLTGGIVSPCFANLTGGCISGGSGSGASSVGAAGTVQFASTTLGNFSSNTLLFWDNTNNRLGVGSSTPGSLLSVHSTAGLAGTAPIFTIASSTSAGLSTTTLFTVLGNGNVGIGTTSPGQALSVNGSGFFNGNLTATNIIATGTLNVAGGALFSSTLGVTGQTTLGNASTSALTVSNGNLYVTNTSGDANSGIRFWTDVNLYRQGTSPVGLRTNSNLYVDGNVGIGNSIPLYKTEITGTSGASTGASGNGILALTTGTGLGTDNAMQFGIVDGSYGWIQPLKPGSSTENLILNPTGSNVGIGTTGPLSKLDVNGGVAIGSYAGTVAAPSNSLIVSGNVAIGTTSPLGTFDVKTATNQHIQFINNTNGADPGAVGITTINDANNNYTPLGFYASSYYFGDGNVGIGTTTPGSSLLRIDSGNGSVANNGLFINNSPDSSHTDLTVLSNWTNGNGGNLVSVGNATGNMFLINNAGNVGIGTTTPGQALSVNGSGFFNGNLTATNVTATGTLTVGGAFTDNGFATFAKGVLIEPTVVSGSGDPSYYYPNVVAYSFDNNATGTLIIHTNIASTSNEMFKIHVTGYGYGNSSNIDFNVVGYAYSGQNSNVSHTAGAVISYSANDNGTDAMPKWVGIDSNGNVDVAVGAPTASNYFYRLSADYWSTKTGDNASSGWSVSTSTTAGFGWKDLHLLTPDVTQTVAGGVGIGTNNPGRGLISTPLDVEIPTASTTGGIAYGLFIGGNDTNPLGGGFYNIGGATIANRSFNIQATGLGLNTADLNLNPQGGFVGIGTTSPSSLLSIGTNSGLATSTVVFAIASSTSANLSTTTVMTVRGNGDVYANNFIDTSLGGSVCIGENAGLLVNSNCVTSVSNSDNTLTISPTSGAVVASLNLAHSNTWSANQFFTNASSTNFTAGLATVGSITSTTTATSTFAGSVQVTAGVITCPEYTVATTSSTTVDWSQGCQQIVGLGATPMTISFSKYANGQPLRLEVCQNPVATTTVYWDPKVQWSYANSNAGKAPVLDTGLSQCNLVTFSATNATGTAEIQGGLAF